MRKKLFILAQYCTPQHLLSRIIGKFAASENTFIKKQFITHFSKRFEIDLREAEIENPEQYPSFNAFFCRALKRGARPIDPNPKSIVSPADGAFSQIGNIKSGRIFQAKNQSYSAAEILADADLARIFEHGKFATIYLAPKDYHRVHMPLSGSLVTTRYVPGDLFSVNPVTAENVPRLFSRNERHISIFNTEVGTVAVILVGAMIVAGIETVWDGQVAPSHHRTVQKQQFADSAISLKRGEEMGRFKLGSTVVLLFQQGKINWHPSCRAEKTVRMGEAIGFVGSEPSMSGPDKARSLENSAHVCA